MVAVGVFCASSQTVAQRWLDLGREVGIALAQRAMIAGPLEEVSAALMKRPPRQMAEDDATNVMGDWIRSVT